MMELMRRRQISIALGNGSRGLATQARRCMPKFAYLCDRKFFWLVYHTERRIDASIFNLPRPSYKFARLSLMG